MILTLSDLGQKWDSDTFRFWHFQILTLSASPSVGLGNLKQILKFHILQGTHISPKAFYKLLWPGIKPTTPRCESTLTKLKPCWSRLLRIVDVFVFKSKYAVICTCKLSYYCRRYISYWFSSIIYFFGHIPITFRNKSTCTLWLYYRHDWSYLVRILAPFFVDS